MDEDVQLRRLIQVHEEHGGLTVAVDLDNTLFDFHHEKEKHLRKEYDFSEVYTLLARLKAFGCYIIIWTANEDDEFVRTFLLERNIPYDAINENPPYFKSGSRKIFYNVLLDDAGGLRETYLLLCRFLEHVSLTRNGNSAT
jgi:hypothetical protein